jgi:hypothetical protein
MRGHLGITLLLVAATCLLLFSADDNGGEDGGGDGLGVLRVRASGTNPPSDKTNPPAPTPSQSTGLILWKKVNQKTWPLAIMI